MLREVTAAGAKTSAVGGGGGVGEPTILRVPDMIRSKPKDYEPRIISLGPYHRGNQKRDDLKYLCLNTFLNRLITKHSMEEMKRSEEQGPGHDTEQTERLRAKDHLVGRLPPRQPEPGHEGRPPIPLPEPILEAINTQTMKRSEEMKRLLEEKLVFCLEKMKELEDQTRKAYKDSNEMSSDDFIRMMLLDGSIVIETLLFWGLYYESPEAVQERSSVIKASSLREAARDMLLLENQLPFSLLQTLFDLIYRTSGTKPKRTLIDVTHSFARTICRGGVGKIPSEPIKYHHILHFLHCCIAQQPDRPTSWLIQRPAYSYWESLQNLLSYQRQQNHHVMLWIPSATQLKEAGIRFSRKKQAKSFIDVTFKDGEMEIPRLIVDDQTNVLFRNLIAFEQCCCKHDNTPVTSYAFLMDCIINTADDIVLLQKDRIVINSSGDNKEVADFFNNLCKDVLHTHHKNLVRIFVDVNKHCAIRYKTWWESFRHLHFKNPWTIMGLLVAIFFFVLGTAQTVYAVLSYIRPKN